MNKPPNPCKGGPQMTDAEFFAMVKGQDTNPREQSNETGEAKRATKFVHVWVCQGNYGSDWDDLTASPNYKEIRDDIRDYRNNEPNPHRLIRRRITRENFETGNY